MQEASSEYVVFLVVKQLVFRGAGSIQWVSGGVGGKQWVSKGSGGKAVGIWRCRGQAVGIWSEGGKSLLHAPPDTTNLPPTLPDTYFLTSFTSSRFQIPASCTCTYMFLLPPEIHNLPR